MSDDLFSSSTETSQLNNAPLPDRMRPRTLDEFIGQDHVVGPGRLLRRAIQRDRLSSLIISGPPGTGKTTLALVIANTTKSRFLSINAVLSGVQAIRDAVESAQREHDLYDRRTILFVDEVHRWNKSQQDALLPYVENGTIILIGATTENPYFEVNKALVSRSRVFQFSPLTKNDLLKAANAAINDKERGYGKWKIVFKDNSLEHLVDVADGDARSLLNALELAVETSADKWPPEIGSTITVDMETAEESIQKRAVLYDRDGDYHYDAISAFIKSLRGSDPDAALYWLARMVYAGEDPKFIWRRMLISASEDVGLADPNAITVVESCASAFERIGLQEGQFHLAEAALYLATAPKSNSALAYFDAFKAVEKESASVPNHLKDSSRDADGLGHGKGYQYPHAFKDHWTAQQYLPDSFKGSCFYQPGNLGYEAKVRDEILRRRDAQLAAWLSGDFDFNTKQENNVAPKNHQEATSLKHKNETLWVDRAEAGKANGLAGLRDKLFFELFPPRHSNILVCGCDNGLFLREAVRICTEGSVCGLCKSATTLQKTSDMFFDVEDLLKPNIDVLESPMLLYEKAKQVSSHNSFDFVIMNGIFSYYKDNKIITEAIDNFYMQNQNKNCCFVIVEKIAKSGVLPTYTKSKLQQEIQNKFEEIDNEFFNSIPSYDCNYICNLFETNNNFHLETSEYNCNMTRKLSENDIALWLSNNSQYGSFVRSKFLPNELKQIEEALQNQFNSGSNIWPASWSIVKLTGGQK